MQSLNDDERKEVLCEVLADELKAIHELVSDIPKISRKANKLVIDVGELKNDMKAVKAVIKEHSKQLTNHVARITQVEIS